MSCNLRGSTHKRMHVTRPLVQREVINLISLTLQCSNKLRDSGHSSNCQYEIHQCGLRGYVAEVTSHTSLSKNRLLVSGHVHTNASVWTCCQHLSGLISLLKIIFYIHAYMPNISVEENFFCRAFTGHLSQQLYLFQQVAFHCLVLITGNRCSRRRCIISSDIWLPPQVDVLHTDCEPCMRLFVHLFMLVTCPGFPSNCNRNSCMLHKSAVSLNGEMRSSKRKQRRRVWISDIQAGHQPFWFSTAALITHLLFWDK